MKIHALSDAPAPPLARGLEEFERRFSYPLGLGRSFRISHGEDYPRFFRAMSDEARCFVAEDRGKVRGVLGVAIRPLRMPDGARRRAAYIGDVKIDPDARGSLLFLRLAQAGLAWGRPLADCAYGVVMDGTPAAPSEYTGRIGIPYFGRVAQLAILRLSTAAAAGRSLPPLSPPGATGRRYPGDLCSDDAPQHRSAEYRRPVAPIHPDNRRTCDCPLAAASADIGLGIYDALSAGQITPGGGSPATRSEIEPAWIISSDGLACGRLEDTRRAKRLIGDDGIEMHSAHLACFAWRSATAAAQVLHAARQRSAALGIPALFVAVSVRRQAGILAALGPVEAVIAPATVYGARLPADAEWSINSSEI